MGSADIGEVLEIALAATREYADKDLALQKNLSVVAKEADYALLKEVIQQYILEAGKLQANLNEALAKVVEIETRRARQEQYSERWWQQKRLALQAAFREDPQKGLRQWLQTYTESLIAWELAICKKLVGEPFPFPKQPVDMHSLFQNGIQAIEEERYLQALDMLTYLTQATSANQTQPILDKVSRAILLIFVGRIYLYVAFESETALKLFMQAQDLAPNHGLPYAALGSYYLAQHDSSQPLSLYQRAIVLSPNNPDGYIGMGLLLEERAAWAEADDWYGEAIGAVREEKDIQAALCKLLAPVSGNLYLQLAQTLRKEDPEQALQAVERAIILGIKRDGDYPERLGYSLKGEILEDLGRLSEATEARYEAGQRFYWRDEYTTAVDILTHANKLNPKHVPIYWYLSDALRLSSYQTTPPHVDKDSIERSLATWEQGYKLELPGNDYSWAYVTRALINEQLVRLPGTDSKQWTLWWEAVVYVERAMLYAVDASTWAYLGRYYRYLGQEASAHQAILKALDLDSENRTALEEQAAFLVDRGEVETAEEAIERLQKLESIAWLDGLKASNLLYKGLLKEDKSSYEEAVEILDRVLQTTQRTRQATSVETITETVAKEKPQTTQPALQATPEEIWYHDLRGDCYLMLGETLRAREDFEWNWEQYKQWPNTENMSAFGWAAYNLAWTSEDRNSSFYDYINQAIEIFSKLYQEPVGAGNAYRNLGLSYLTRGDLTRGDLSLGEESLNKGIALATNKRELNEVQNVDFSNIKKASANQPHEAQVREILARLNEQINTRRMQLEQGRFVEEELKEALERSPLEGDKINWAWIGVHASLARLQIEEKRWSEAKTTYLLLQSEGGRFPEASLGLEKIFYGLQVETDDHVKEGRPTEALEQLAQILTLELLPDDNTKQAQFYSHLGYVYFELADTDNARTHFTKALQLFRVNDTRNPGVALSEACQPLLRDATHYLNLDAEWKATIDNSATDEILRSDLAIARNSLAKYLALLYYNQNKYEQAEPLLQRALAIDEKALGPDDLEVATDLNNLAGLYDAQGKYEQAEPLYKRTLAIVEQQLGSEHLDTVQSLNNLANLYYNQNKYEQAEPLYKRTLAIVEQQLGPEHPDTVTVRESLAELYRAQGKYEQAEPLLQRALAIDEKALGSEHPEVATDLNSLALLYDTQGKYEQAEPLYQRALTIREQALGPEHPDTAQSLNNLAQLYRAQGKYEQAEPLLQRALAIVEQRLGPKDSGTVTVRENLVELYRAQGKYEQAEPLLQRALAIDEKALGPEHPEVATDLNNLAALYYNQNKYEQAEPLLQRALAIVEQQLGPEHPDTAQSLNNLARIYQDQGKYEQAEPLYQRALAIREQALGPEHSDTARSLNNLALLYDAQGKYEQAEPLYQHALTIMEQQLGMDDPDTVTVRENLAGLYRAQGKYEQAEPLLQRALAIREQALGPEHPDTAQSLNNLAALYDAQGKHEQAEPLLQRVLAIDEKALGPEHPEVATDLNNLAALYYNQNKYEQAEPLLQRALAIVEKQSGPEHLDTASILYSLAELYYKQDKYEQAEPLYQRTLTIVEQQLGPEHPGTATVRESYNALLKDMKQKGRGQQ